MTRSPDIIKPEGLEPARLTVEQQWRVDALYAAYNLEATMVSHGAESRSADAIVADAKKFETFLKGDSNA